MHSRIVGELKYPSLFRSKVSESIQKNAKAPYRDYNDH